MKHVAPAFRVLPRWPQIWIVSLVTECKEQRLTLPLLSTLSLQGRVSSSFIFQSCGGRKTFFSLYFWRQTFIFSLCFARKTSIFSTFCYCLEERGALGSGKKRTERKKERKKDRQKERKKDRNTERKKYGKNKRKRER